jgi:hypothetical protein
MTTTDQEVSSMVPGTRFEGSAAAVPVPATVEPSRL